MTALKKHEPTKAERFSEMVMSEFKATTPNLSDGMNDFTKRLCQNYFISLDMVLKKSEEKRLSKPEAKRDKLPFHWDNVNLQQMALDVVTYARVGLDPFQNNHIAMIPYKNSKTSKFDIGFIMEYRGIELKARKYGIESPEVIVELVYSTDNFRPIKKDTSNLIEDYEFEIKEPFKRGEIIGGFYYHRYEDSLKNKLVIFTLNDILKRKPKHASAEFWGGEKTKWKDDKPAGKETIDGWKEKMYYKTIYRAAWNDITIDSKKIDDDFTKIAQISNDSTSPIEDNIKLAEANTKTLPSPSSPEPSKPENKEVFGGGESSDKDKETEAGF